MVQQETALPSDFHRVGSRRSFSGHGTGTVLTNKLKRELPRMLAEHKGIVAALERLQIAARVENKPEIENSRARWHGTR